MSENAFERLKKMNPVKAVQVEFEGQKFWLIDAKSKVRQFQKKILSMKKRDWSDEKIEVNEETTGLSNWIIVASLHDYDEKTGDYTRWFTDEQVDDAMNLISQPMVDFIKDELEKMRPKTVEEVGQEGEAIVKN